jgi:hypothetical protein
MYTKLNMIFYKFIMAEPNSGSPKWQQYSPAGLLSSVAMVMTDVFLKKLNCNVIKIAKTVRIWR